MKEQPHGNTYCPDIRGFAWITLRTGELVLWASESRSTCREIRNIISPFVPNCSKVNHNDLISNSLRFSAKYIVDFDVSICDIVIMQILHCFTDLTEYDSSDISKATSFVFISNVLHHFRIALVAVIKLSPDHDLP